jgi:hypothetical protein
MMRPVGKRVAMRRSRRTATALAVDVMAVLMFVAIGRRSHDEGSAVTEFIKTAAPFVIALGFGWLTSRAWNSPIALATGAVIWAETIVLGMLLRRFAFDRGTAVSFIIVTAVFLGMCLIGWRAIVELVRRRQNSTATAGTS